MNIKHILAVVAVGAAVLSGAYLVQSVYRVTPVGYSYTTSRRWSAPTHVASPRGTQTPRSAKVATKVQVGDLSEATKRLQTKATIVRH